MSDPTGGPSRSFDLLHEGIRRWIWRSGWEELRDIQEQSIPLLLTGDCDVVVAASTASGKTEAAFLPIVSRLASEEREEGGGFDAIYVSPLRALINDQFGRIEGLCEELGIDVVKWHGDVAASVKARARKRPNGIVLTTPESLEALLCRRGPEAVRLFGALSYIVVDEMHAFLGVPRGRQLQSLLHRIELAAGRMVTRVGLSATLADMQVACDFLRPGGDRPVKVVSAPSSGGTLRLQLRGYVRPAGMRSPPPSDGSGDDEIGSGDAPVISGDAAEAAITRDIFEALRGTRSLIFAGARRRVESVSSDLGLLTEAAGVPDEFFAHHGSLSRELREEAERRLKDEGRPASIVCTTTLELGIDVGHIEQVAQLGPGRTVSGMRQRLGRSGRRRGQPAVMRLYVSENESTSRTSPIDLLRCDTVQTVAMVNLMLHRWNEPMIAGRLHLSTLVQQVLALIAQHGGVTALQAWNSLCASSVFPEVDQNLFAKVLRRMGSPDVRLIEQVADGTLLPGAEGEKVLAGYDFFAVFMTPVEFRIVTDDGRTLGTVPVEDPLIPQQLIIFGGRRWRVLEVDPSRKEILVTRARGGQPPIFGGDHGAPDEGVVLEMREIWQADEIPTFLDECARELLREGRRTFRRLGLDKAAACRHGEDLLLFPWCGARAQTALALALNEQNVEATPMGLAVSTPVATETDLKIALNTIAQAEAPDAIKLAAFVPDKIRDKYDHYLGDELLNPDWASEYLDALAVPRIAAVLRSGLS